MRRLMWSLVFLAGCPAASDTLEQDEETQEDLPPPGLGHCVYANSMSGAEECRSYTGSGWTEESARSNCDAPGFPADPGVFVAGTLCDYEVFLGVCSVDEGMEEAYELVFPGSDEALCAGLEIGCGFAGGAFTGAGPCEGEVSGPTITEPFTPFAEVCVDEPGADDGSVCVWNAISGAVEEGYRFEDYGDCDAVRTQRPYVAYDNGRTSDELDPRLSDPEWMEEFEWVTAQAEASACVCCHAGSAPDGASGWRLDLDPIWLDSASDSAVAMFAGWTDSSALGAFDPEVLYGFDRFTTGLPTTDVARMQAFMEAELARRGRTVDEFASAPPWGGPLVDQLAYEPELCGEGVGLMEDGTLAWPGGAARYVYVLEADAVSPTVPPNLDLPDGTIWRIQVTPDQQPIESGVTYGTVPRDADQGFPSEGAPEPLSSGDTYYFVVLADIVVPTTRCLFTAP